jgi:hypothetical protein
MGLENAIKERFRDRFKVSAARMDICETCDSYNEITTQCKECGCFMAVKTMLKSSSCPLKKWGPHTEEEPEQ